MVVEENKKSNVTHYITITVVATLLIVVGLLFFVPGFDYKLVYIPSDACYKDTLYCSIDSTSTLGDCLDCIIDQKVNRLSELEMLSRLQDRGLIVSPNDYTSRISSYYSVLVAFLVGLFVLFTIIGYFSIKSKFTEEFDRERKNIKEEINNSLMQHLVDSKEVERVIVEALRGKVTDDVIQCMKDDADEPEGKEDMKKTIDKIKKDIDTLFTAMVELQSDMAAKENIE